MLPPFKSLVAAVATVAISATASLAAPALTPLVSTDWLQAHLGEEDLVILDVNFRSAAGDTKKGAAKPVYVPGAVTTPYPGPWRSKQDGVPGQMSSVEGLETYLSSIGINGDVAVVVVSSGENGTDFSAGTRVYWTLKELGLTNVGLLDGGMRAWNAEGKPVRNTAAAPDGVFFTAKPDPAITISTDEVAESVGTDTVLLDARPASFFVGKDKHKLAPRPGRLPGAVDLDYNAFIDAKTGKLKSKPELAMIASVKLADKKADIVSYCNTGHWASANWFVLHELLGYENVRLYDASMVGWTLDPKRPVLLGEGRKG
ncbi:rhodanese-like domain-containing protein [Breoghania sp.]|uniref:sulfurtransferase n=1 Tax=Breoghania sp. TaxID=2065378 RepID=UPI002AA7F156|nr:rhodanese-like domain-containing protein [Breoghania sp.]